MDRVFIAAVIFVQDSLVLGTELVEASEYKINNEQHHLLGWFDDEGSLWIISKNDKVMYAMQNFLELILIFSKQGMFPTIQTEILLNNSGRIWMIRKLLYSCSRGREEKVFFIYREAAYLAHQ